MTITPDTLAAMRARDRAFGDGESEDADAIAQDRHALLNHCDALEVRVAAWRKLAFTINTRRLSDGTDDDAAALEEAHHRAWAEVQRVDPEWQAASRKASK